MEKEGWILFSQSAIFLSLIGMSLIDPLQNIQLLALFAFFEVFFGSIQDVAVDALRIEIGEEKEQGDLVQLIIRISSQKIFVATSMALIFADLYSWSYVYQLMAFYVDRIGRSIDMLRAK